MPTLTIDGQEITVDRGTSILDAAKELGVDIPTFCYHPGLSRPANCRMCLVETNKAPKPLPACYAEAMDGMEVSTQSPEITKTRKAVLEFILLNHPVDCPICDQAGECVLQDHYFKYSAKPSRLNMRKVHKPKVKRLGPDIVLDAERCILCTRCVRFCDEIAKSSQLEIANRGEHSEITTFPGEQLDNPYAGNTVDICPVGALTSIDFRFKTRVWFLQSATGVCPECSRGCKVRVDTFENSPRRYKPQHNPQVNDYWMCDVGRLSYKDYLDGRVEGPATTSDGKRRVTTAAQAVEGAVAELQAVSDKARLAVVVTPWSTNEDAFLVGKLLAGPLKGAKVFMGGRADGEGDDILVRPDKNPNRKGVELILKTLGVAWQPLSALSGSFDGALVIGDDHAMSDEQRGTLEAASRRVVMGAFMTPLWKASTTFLPLRTHFEKRGTFTNFEGVVQRIDQATAAAGTCKSEGWYAMKLAEGLGEPMGYRTPDEVFADLVATVPGFEGMTYDNLRPHGMKLGEAPKPERPDEGSERPDAPPPPPVEA
ncbi:MAG: 2Fe-2S iron-sulfur cluster-binding protein [Myxococcota bacterium]